MSGLRNVVAVVVLSLATILLISAVATAVNIGPECDTYVDSRTGQGDQYGISIHLGDTSPSNGQVDRARGYFRFDLTDAIPPGAYPTYATLNVRCHGFYSPPFDVGAYYLEDDTWDCSINWSQAPAPATSPTATVLVTTSGWYQWVVTNDVIDAWDDDQGYSVVLRHVTETGSPHNSDWTSSEGYVDYRPYLSVGFQYGYDFGDAPDPSYPTLLASNGARHSLETGPHLGDYIDYESDGQPHPDALGDDAGWPAIDDEDGVTFTSLLIPGETATVTVVSSGHGYLSAWIDFDINGSWNELGELIFGSHEVWTGTNLLSFDVPIDAAAGRTFARFRVRAVDFPILSYDGSCDSGEVEDHTVYLGETDWGDAPDPTYPTTSASDGAWHLIANGLYLGATVDHELDGQPHPGAIGDDNNGDDEDGVVFTSWLMPGRNATVEVVSSAGGYLDAWIDFNGDGSWAEFGDQIFAVEPLVAGINVLTFTVPAGASQNIGTFARFRVSSTGGLPFNGFAEDGEVEDYFFDIKPVTEKWLQSPDLSETCVDVNTSYPYALADNFVC
ncbi:DNRLRE domain-containing protein, partial [bacterium]|nr:DNRLRE domain-containing protein [bacterium]